MNKKNDTGLTFKGFPNRLGGIRMGPEDPGTAMLKVTQCGSYVAAEAHYLKTPADPFPPGITRG